MPTFFNFVLALALMSSVAFTQQVGILPVGNSEGGLIGLPPVEIVQGSLLVKCKPFLGPCNLADLHLKAGAVLVQKFSVPAGLELLKVPPGTVSEHAMAVYLGDPRVEYAEPNYIVHARGIPNDPCFPYQWALNNVGQTGGSIDADINAPLAWEGLSGSSSVVIGINDTGVNYLHPDLKNNMWVNSQEIPGNGKDDDGNGSVDDVYGIDVLKHSGTPMDDHSHGTHVAGIIGAEGNNGIGISGVMQRAKIIACKFLDSSGTGDIASAIACMDYFVSLAKRAKDPIKIVATNNSWGGKNFSLAFSDAVKAHQKLGILLVAAAGNDGISNDATNSFPANLPFSNVVSVAATDNQDALALFSNYGAHSVHVAAPGVEILSAVLGTSYGYWGGTSMAAAFVTGLAGHIKGANPSADWIAIKNLIIAGGEPTSGTFNSTISGRRIRMRDIDGEGSVSCVNQTVIRRLFPKASMYSMRVGQSLALSLLQINCAKSMQVVAVLAIKQFVPGPIPSITLDAVLNDLGENGDDIAFDGVFTGVFKPAVAGDYQLNFPGDDNVIVSVIN